METKYLQPEVSDASEVLHLKLWEQTAFDYSLNGNNGTAANTSFGDRCYTFNGANSIITVPADPSIDVNGKTVLSVGAWINPASDGEEDYARIVDKGGFVLRVSNEADGLMALRCIIYHTGWVYEDAAHAVTNLVVPINTWSHVAFVYNEDSAKRIKIYRNGVLQALDTNTAGVGSPDDDSAANLIIGNSDGLTKTFDGLISDVRIYSTVRTAAHIRDFYNQTRWRYGV